MTAYVEDTGKPWTATLGFSHAIFEVGLDVVKRAADLTDKASIMEAIASTDLNTIVGPINWANGPVKNVTKTPLGRRPVAEAGKRPARTEDRQQQAEPAIADHRRTGAARLMDARAPGLRARGCFAEMTHGSLAARQSVQIATAPCG